MKRLTRLTAQDILDSYDLGVEDSRSDEEKDLIEERIETLEEEGSDAELFNDDRVFGSEVDVRSSSLNNQMTRSSTVDMIDKSVFEEVASVIYGRTTKTKPKPPFEWSSIQNQAIPPVSSQKDAKIIEELKDERSIIVFFKMLLTEEIINLIIKYTNIRISLIENSKISNAKYRAKCEKMKNQEVSVDEMYSFIGLYIMFGLTGKSDVSIEEIWCEKSAQFAPFASVTMSRDRFQYISKNICFDDIRTRENRKTHKFHKMLEIFNLFKENLKLIHPSDCLCIDETLYSFRGHCFCRQFIPSKPARYGIKYWCIVDTRTGITFIFYFLFYILRII
jgi:hypothetical protein